MQRPRQGGTENDPKTLRFPYRNLCKSPFFEGFFREILVEFFIKIIKKGAAKKAIGRYQTNRQIWAGPGQLRDRVLDSQNADTIRKNLQNVSPKQDPNFS